MRHLAITGIETVLMICLISLGLAMRDTPPSARMIAGTRSSAMTATAPDFSATSACATLITSMMTPPLSISARPVFRRRLALLPLLSDICFSRLEPFILLCADERRNPVLAQQLSLRRVAVLLLQVLGKHAMSVNFDERGLAAGDRKSTRLNSSHVRISYAVFCLKK